MRYFYARVSTREQNTARQLEAARQSGREYDRIFCDKQSGKNFDRPAYQELKALLQRGDEVVVKSLDRLGRDKDGVKSELAWMREHGVILRVLDIPTTLVEYPAGQEWVMEMVNNILIEVISAIAEQERVTIRQRQAEGIAAMPVVNGRRVSAKTGRAAGRPAYDVPEKLFSEIRAKNKKGLLSVREACAELGIGRTKWYELVNRCS